VRPLPAPRRRDDARPVTPRARVRSSARSPRPARRRDRACSYDGARCRVDRRRAHAEITTRDVDRGRPRTTSSRR
jgi:hypothetical protein